MHCFACDTLLDNPQPDVKTGRYYCAECFEPTESVIYYNQQKELEKFIEGYEPDFPDDIPLESDITPISLFDEDDDA